MYACKEQNKSSSVTPYFSLKQRDNPAIAYVRLSLSVKKYSIPFCLVYHYCRVLSAKSDTRKERRTAARDFAVSVKRYKKTSLVIINKRGFFLAEERLKVV